MGENKHVNILLLGETGTGKSLLINAFANYLNFSSLAEAEDAAALECIIPAKFSITTEDDDVVLIIIGACDNEDGTIGNSTTQCARTHRFDYGDKIIQIIDTPGINDSRGAAAKDQENMENIMHCLEQYKKIYAVCFLLKPDMTVITAAFKYSLLELLSRLHCSAAENIIFVFTRTKGTDYGAPDSLNCLHQFIDDIREKQGVSVPLRYKKSERRNCFFVDNEGLKYFMARTQGYRMKNGARLRTSWDISYKACRDMIKYILGDENNKPLQPHMVQDTICISKARQLINKLCHSLKDVNNQVHKALDKIKAHQDALKKENLTAEERQKKLVVKRVCASNNCTQIIQAEVIEAKKRALDALEKYYNELAAQREEIGLAMAKFAHFNQTNSMCPINYAYEEYLDVLIKNENKGDHSSKDLLDRYTRMKEEHIRYKMLLAECESDAKEKRISNVTAEEVLKICNRLKNMSYTEKTLSDMHAKVVASQEKMKCYQPKKTKNELSAEIEDDFSQGGNEDKIIKLIQLFVQAEQGNHLIKNMRTFGNAIGNAFSVFDTTVDGANENNVRTASNLSDLWRNIKATNDPAARIKMFKDYFSSVNIGHKIE